MSSNVQIVSSKAAKVGKFFSNSKVLFSWEVLVGNKLLNFEFIDSRSSGKKRLFVNKVQVLDKVSKSKDFRIQVVFENTRFLVFSEGDIFRIKVNDSMVSPKPTTIVETTSSNNPLLANSEVVTNINYEEVQDSIVLKDGSQKRKEHPYSNPSHENGRPVPPTTGRNPSLASNPAFDVLNDSDDLYDHDYNFLAIKEQNENLEMLKYVNNIK